MTIRELIKLLIDSEVDMDYEVFVSSPDNKDDYFLDSIAVNNKRKQLFIKTAQ